MKHTIETGEERIVMDLENSIEAPGKEMFKLIKKEGDFYKFQGVSGIITVTSDKEEMGKMEVGNLYELKYGV